MLKLFCLRKIKIFLSIQVLDSPSEFLILHCSPYFLTVAQNSPIKFPSILASLKCYKTREMSKRGFLASNIIVFCTDIHININVSKIKLHVSYLSPRKIVITLK